MQSEEIRQAIQGILKATFSCTFTPEQSRSSAHNQISFAELSSLMPAHQPPEFLPTYRSITTELDIIAEELQELATQDKLQDFIGASLSSPQAPQRHPQPLHPSSQRYIKTILKTPKRLSRLSQVHKY